MEGLEEMEEQKQKEEGRRDKKIRRSGKGKKLLIGILGVVATLLAVAYITVAVYYNERFFPGTTINGTDYGNADKIAVAVKLMLELKDYQLEVTGRDPKTGEKESLAAILAQDVELRADIGEADVDRLLSLQNEWLWPEFLWSKGYTYTISGDFSIDEDKLAALLGEQPAFQAKNMKAAEDAYIKGYSEAEKTFVIEPEVEGTQLDMEKVYSAIRNAIETQTRTIDLEEQGCYVEPAVRADDSSLQECVTQANRCLETRITYDWNTNKVVLSGEQIRDWITIENKKVVLDTEAVAAFVEENAKKFDTYGKNRNFRTVMGIELSLPSGAFGWLTDKEAETEALKELILAGTVGEREPIYAVEGAWKGMNDIGNTYVEADMTHQHLYLYQKGELKLETDFVSGNMSNGCTTPQGVFGLTYKTTNAVLRGADYVTPVNYWMPFHGNYGMHDATWRDSFGGDIYLTNGSHGCLNLPLDKAAEIYQYMTEGFPIICYYYPPGVLPEVPEEEESEEE